MTDLLGKTGASGARLACLGEGGVRAGGVGLRGEVKRCGGQLGVLRGGTGGKAVSEFGEISTTGGESGGALERYLVLSLGTGLSLPPSPSSLPSLSGTDL